MSGYDERWRQVDEAPPRASFSDVATHTHRMMQVEITVDSSTTLQPARLAPDKSADVDRAANPDPRRKRLPKDGHLRIAHVTATFPPYFGGTGNVAYHNALELARRGHDVTVFTADYPRGNFAYPPEMTVRHLPVTFRFGNAPFLAGLGRISGFDLVHLHYPFYFGAETVLLRCWSAHIPYVVTYHQDVVFNGFLRWAARLHQWCLGRRVLTGAAALYATSWDYATSSNLATLIRTRGTKVAELPNGVDAQRFHAGSDSPELRSSYGLDSEDQIVLFVGALDAPHFFKGVRVLLDAIAALDDLRIKLVIVGDGNLRSHYQAYARGLGVEGRVTFCGRVSDVQLPQHYALCDLLVLPSTTMGEAFGVVLLEAMASGKPVIASNLPGVRSVVSNGEDGILVRPGDPTDLARQISHLLADPARRARMGRAGRRKVEERYDWAIIGGRLEQLYLQALQPLRKEMGSVRATGDQDRET